MSTRSAEYWERELSRLYREAPVHHLDKNSRYVILSDLHMGDGGKNDDFRANSQLFLAAIREYYAPRGYSVILNGDIEELLRHRRDAIRRAWPEIYSQFEVLREEGRLVRLIGNHEMVPGQDDFTDEHGSDGEALRLEWKGNSLLVYHGHQAGHVNSGRYNRLIGIFLRTIANTLGIGNYSVSHNSAKKFSIERNVYDFSRNQGIVSVIGHTHRPLFESLSKEESLAFEIERLCRRYANATEETRMLIRETINKHREDYQRRLRPHEPHLADMVYGKMLVPCLFNSGCGIGKRGITMLEIKNSRFYLVFWSDQERTDRFTEYNEYKPATILGSRYRFILRREALDYIFARIELLGFGHGNT